MTVDVVVIASVDRQQRVLLVRRKSPPFAGSWALPGGFVEPNEPLETAARRELVEETGMSPAHMKQLQAFGDPGRDPRGWTISIAFVAELDEDALRSWCPRAGSDAGEVGWFLLQNLPSLAFDHEQILTHAAQYLTEVGLPGGNHPA